MRQLLLMIAVAFGLLSAPVLAQQEPLPPEAQAFLDSLSPRSGTIELSEADATLDLGDSYLFYGPEDARAILVDAWGNPPEEADGVLGLVMPAGTTPLSDAWAAVVTYEASGYVTDDDAAEADYDELLQQMQEGTIAANAERREAGFPGVTVIGWAQAPHYDAASHSVIWARELAFEGQDVNSLNYDIRSLGRAGVLSLNMLSTMPQLDDIRTAANDFATHAAFNQGARYADFDSSTDEVAGYGIAGLVAGGLGLAVAKKAGLLVLLLKFIKPILIGLALFFGVFFKRIKALFGVKDTEQEHFEDETADDPVASEPAPVEPAPASSPPDDRAT